MDHAFVMGSQKDISRPSSKGPSKSKFSTKQAGSKSKKQSKNSSIDNKNAFSSVTSIASRPSTTRNSHSNQNSTKNNLIFDNKRRSVANVEKNCKIPTLNKQKSRQAVKYLDRLLQDCKNHQNNAQKEFDKFEKQKFEIVDTFSRLERVSSLISHDEPFLHFIKNKDQIHKNNFTNYYSKLANDKKIYTLDYDNDIVHDQELVQLMKEDDIIGTKSKESNFMMAKNYIVSKYNKKFRLTNRAKKWNIKF